jgi:hypothetical protein
MFPFRPRSDYLIGRNLADGEPTIMVLGPLSEEEIPLQPSRRGIPQSNQGGLSQEQAKTFLIKLDR